MIWAIITKQDKRPYPNYSLKSDICVQWYKKHFTLHPFFLILPFYILIILIHIPIIQWSSNKHEPSSYHRITRQYKSHNASNITYRWSEIWTYISEEFRFTSFIYYSSFLIYFSYCIIRQYSHLRLKWRFVFFIAGRCLI